MSLQLGTAMIQNGISTAVATTPQEHGNAHGSLEAAESLLLFGPGPSNISARVLDAARHQPLTPSNRSFLKYLEEVQLMIRRAFRTENKWTFAVSGAAHAAMEMGLCSALERGDHALIAIHGGLWGHRAAEMCRRHGIRVTVLEVPVGRVFAVDQLERALKEHEPDLFFTCHGESTTGVLQPVQELGRQCHKYDCLLMVDAVASLAASPVHMDDWEVDILYSGAQKAISALPGISMISFSDRSMRRIRNRELDVQSFYLDARLVGSYWGCDDVPFTTAKYHHTPPANLLYALREALVMLEEDTLEARWKMHRENSDRLCDGLKAMGLEVTVEDPEIRLPSVTVINVPDDIDCQEFCNLLLTRFRMEIKSGLGPTRGHVWRIGLMGYNCTPENVEYALSAVRQALKHFRGGDKQDSPEKYPTLTPPA